MDETIKGITVKVKADTSEIDKALQKTNQLKSLLLEVKKLAASLNVDITFERKEN